MDAVFDSSDSGTQPPPYENLQIFCRLQMKMDLFVSLQLNFITNPITNIMKRLFHLAITLMVSVAVLLTACKKDEPKPDNSGNNNNQETPGGGGGGEGEVTPNQEYPETAVVLPQAVTDIDGNTYDAVRIGNQVWMAENLRTTRYADGTAIPLGTSSSTTTAYRYAPGSNQSNEENMENVAHYGYLYNWPAVMHNETTSEANPSGVQGICPNGWHVPSDAEWIELTDYMSTQPAYVASGNPENIAKALATTWGWDSSSETDAIGNNLSTNNATGFSAPPAGIFQGNYGYLWVVFGEATYFWTATEEDTPWDPGAAAQRRSLVNWSPVVTRANCVKHAGISVRCVRD